MTQAQVKPNSLQALADFDFEAADYSSGQKEFMPFAQIINPKASPKGLRPFGVAITATNAEAVNFTPDANWQQITYEFGNGEPTDLYITQTPRLLILQKSPVFLKNRTTEEVVGLLSACPDFATNRNLYKPFTRNIVIFVGTNGEWLHTEPLQFNPSGASGASMMMAFSGFDRDIRKATGFCTELEMAYAQRKGIKPAPKGPLFHAHGIFCPIIEAEEKGVGSNKSLVAYTVDFEHPKAETLEKYLVRPGTESAEKIKILYEGYKEFWVQKRVDIAEIPPHENEIPYPSLYDDDVF